MTPEHILDSWNRKILENYSRHTVSVLRGVMPLRLALPRIESFLAENVSKEVRKGTLVLQAVTAALETRRPIGNQTVEQLLVAHREVDRSFLNRIDNFPIGIVMRYDQIEPVRKQRIALLATTAECIVTGWRRKWRVRAILRSTYDRPELERLVHELMRLYALETQMLSRSLRLPALLVPLREMLAQRIYSVMNEVAQQVARETADVVYRARRP